MVNVVLDLKCIIFKYIVETFNYNQVDPVIKWAQLFKTVTTIKFTFSFIKRVLELRKVLFGVYILLDTKSQ